MPIQKVTKTKVIEKFRSGATTPVSPVQTTSTSSPTPIRPASTSVPRLTTRRETRSLTGRVGVPSILGSRQPSRSPTNETIRMTSEP